MNQRIPVHRESRRISSSDTMRRKWVICIFMGALCGALVVTFSHPSGEPEVTMALVETRPRNNGLGPEVVFVVTNPGRKPVCLSFSALDKKNEDGSFSDGSVPVLGMFGSCSLPPGTNSTVTVQGPSRRGWRARATVFGPSTTFQKVKFAARRLWMRFSGKEKFTKFWISDSYSAMYEICSPEVPELAQRLALRSELGGSRRGCKLSVPSVLHSSTDTENGCAGVLMGRP
jgi:hypothetical protein